MSGTTQPKDEELLIPLEKYLAAGVRIGTHIRNEYMIKRGFIYGVRTDGLWLLDLRKIDERIRIAAKLIARFEPSKVVAVSARQYGFKPVQMFAKYTGAKAITGRFIPGTFTNPSLKHYIEPELVIVTDPRADMQAIDEASRINVPIIALVDTDSPMRFIDLAIPCNNKGRKALALIYWLLTRQVLRERGEIPPDGDLDVPPEEFETRIVVLR